MSPRRSPLLSFAASFALAAGMPAWAIAGPPGLSFRPWSLELPGAPATVIAADLDGDRRVDLVVVVKLRPRLPWVPAARAGTLELLAGEASAPALRELRPVASLLTRDRSRRGSEPVLALHTDCHLWHPMRTYFVDLAATGRQDLVIIHPEGLSGKKLHFQVYTDTGQGRFAAQPRTSSVDVKASDWFYGADFTGDGVPDLLVRDDQSRLLLYPGLAKANRLADRPSWSFHLPVPPPPPRSAKRKTKEDDGGGNGDDHPPVPPPLGARLADLVDLRGDGYPTLFLTIPDAQGRTQIVAVGRVP
jgi:FG-GAP-like repeat